MNMTELHKKRKERRKETAEDFTPIELVNEMLDKIPNEIWENPSKTFIDPAAGNGNFLVEVLKRKIKLGQDPQQALSTIYGVELMADNVEEMKHRLYNIISDYLSKDKAFKILDKNIICHNALEWDFDNWKLKNEKVIIKELF